MILDHLKSIRRKGVVPHTGRKIQTNKNKELTKQLYDVFQFVVKEKDIVFTQDLLPIISSFLKNIDFRAKYQKQY